MKRKTRIKRSSSVGLYRRARIKALLRAKGIERFKDKKLRKGKILKRPSKGKTDPIYEGGRRIIVSNTGERIYADSMCTTGNSMSYVTTDGKRHTIKTPIRPSKAVSIKKLKRPSAKRVPKELQKKTEIRHIPMKRVKQPVKRQTYSIKQRRKLHRIGPGGESPFPIR